MISYYLFLYYPNVIVIVTMNHPSARINLVVVGPKPNTKGTNVNVIGGWLESCKPSTRYVRTRGCPVGSEHRPLTWMIRDWFLGLSPRLGAAFPRVRVSSPCPCECSFLACAGYLFPCMQVLSWVLFPWLVGTICKELFTCIKLDTSIICRMVKPWRIYACESS